MLFNELIVENRVQVVLLLLAGVAVVVVTVGVAIHHRAVAHTHHPRLSRVAVHAASRLVRVIARDHTQFKVVAVEDVGDDEINSAVTPRLLRPPRSPPPSPHTHQLARTVEVARRVVVAAAAKSHLYHPIKPKRRDEPTALASLRRVIIDAASGVNIAVVVTEAPPKAIRVAVAAAVAAQADVAAATAVNTSHHRQCLPLRISIVLCLKSLPRVHFHR